MEYPLLNRIKKETDQGGTYHANQAIDTSCLFLQFFAEIVNFYVPSCLMQLQFVQSILMVINAYFVCVDFVGD